jgi:hypothetical protein
MPEKVPENKGLAKSMFMEWLASVGVSESNWEQYKDILPEAAEIKNVVDNNKGFDSFIDFCMCKAVSLYLKKFKVA